MPLNPRVKSLIETGILLGTAITLAIAVAIGIMIYSGGHSDPLVAVSTGSMMPIYNGFQDSEYDEIYPFRGDILLIRKVPVDSIEIGDVIVFDTSSVPEPVVHRVIAKWFENDSYFFKTNGDNRDDPDNWREGDGGGIPGKNVKGVVVLRIPHIGWFLLALQTLLGRLILIATAIIILFLGNGSEEDKEDEKEKGALIDSEKKKINQNSPESPIKKSIITSEKIAKLFQRRNYIYLTIFFITIGIFFITNILAVFLVPPSTEMYSYSLWDDSLNQNLMTSTTTNTYTINLPDSPQYQWIQGSDTNKTTYFFPIKLKIQSGGFLNNINRVDIITNINETIVGIYRWNIVYNYIGTRILEGGIIASIDSPGTHYTAITINISSRGLFASNPQSYSFPLILEI